MENIYKYKQRRIWTLELTDFGKMLCGFKHECKPVIAQTLLKHLGNKLIGRIVFVKKCGYIPKGFYEIVEINPDPGAPEFAFSAINYDLYPGENYIFDWEKVWLIPYRNNW